MQFFVVIELRGSKTKDEGDVVSVVLLKQDNCGRHRGRYNDVVYRIKISKHHHKIYHQSRNNINNKIDSRNNNIVNL